MQFPQADDNARPRSQERKLRRQAEIAEIVFERGRASAADLAQHFGVSVMTVHRDLDTLAAQGVVRRYHGGAAAQRSDMFEPDATYRMRLGTAAKQQIANTALKYVEPGSSLMLDDSTTTLALAQLLARTTELTVATNFVDIVQAIGANERIRLIGLGGDYSLAHRSFLGQGCVDAISELRVGTLFASTSAMGPDTVFHQEPEIVTVKRAMMGAAERRILLMDHSKLGQTALHRVSSITDWDVVVVDAAAPHEVVEAMTDAGGNVVVADPTR